MPKAFVQPGKSEGFSKILARNSVAFELFYRVVKAAEFSATGKDGRP
jgi:hypothetical protein